MLPSIASTGKVPINRSQSLYLDALRALAAITVVFHHYSNHITNLHYRVFPDIGKEAVMVFFVVSGFVIAMVASGKERNFSTFVVARLARFYSVIVPAVAISLLAYSATLVFDPTVYEQWGNLDHWSAKLLATLTFTTDNLLWQRVYLPGGKPLWSLSYEFGYYFIFAFACLYPQRFAGIGIALLISIFLGIPALLLLPVWLLGALTFYLFRTRAISPALARLCAAGGLAGLAILLISGLRDSTFNTSVLFHCQMADATYFPFYYLIGICVCLNLFGTLKMLDSSRKSRADTMSVAIRHMAQSSFFLYLTHMPVMLLLKAWIGGANFPYLIPILTCGFAFVVGWHVENLRFPLREWLIRRWGSFKATAVAG